ncbi:hypothetical protein A2U01_0069694, partial [Trifolium medium]|nr:hypothetical protein [Trifolium medium]
PDTPELDKEADELIKEGIAKFGETPNPESVAQHLFENKQASNLNFLEEHFSPNPLNEQTFTREQPQPSQPQSQPESEQQQQQQPQTQPESEQQQPQTQPIEPE